jgi:hypothetical protein
MFPLPPELVTSITNLRSLSLVSEPARLAAAVLKNAPPLASGFRMGFVVHKLSGLLTGLLRHLFTSPLPASASRAAPPTTVSIISWEVDPSTESTQAIRGGALRAQLRGIDEMVGIAGLSAAAAAARVNGARLHLLVDVMGWIPEGRQVPTMEMLAWRPCAVQGIKEVHGSSGAPFIDYILSDLIALPPEHALVYTESLLAMPPPLLPNSHRSLYPLPLTSLTPPAAAERTCEWRPNATAVLALYEHYKLDPHLFRRWLAVLRQLRPPTSPRDRRDDDDDEVVVEEEERRGARGAGASWAGGRGGGGYVLVLQQGAYPALTNRVLRREAVEGGLPPDDLVLLPWAPSPQDYIRRFGCGPSLFVDPAIYSAHTVAVDALWAGGRSIGSGLGFRV